MLYFKEQRTGNSEQYGVPHNSEKRYKLSIVFLTPSEVKI